MKLSVIDPGSGPHPSACPLEDPWHCCSLQNDDREELQGAGAGHILRNRYILTKHK